MTEEELIVNIKYLVKKYAPSRFDLIEMIQKNPRGVKGVLNELSLARKTDWEQIDDDLIANISFYYI
ncbi:MAG: hypothetical protein HUJ68_12795 [Clostridia bacterium]|nr:hypothetical protein [Clostridia bacterium]